MKERGGTCSLSLSLSLSLEAAARDLSWITPLPDAQECELREEGALTWALVGAITADDSVEPPRPAAYVAREVPPRTRAEALMGTRSTRDGQVWEVVAVDESRLLPLEPTAEDELGLSPTEPEVGRADPLLPGEEGWIEPQGWGWRDCDETYAFLSPTPYCVTSIVSNTGSCAPAFPNPNYCYPNGDNHYFDMDDDRDYVQVNNERRNAIVVLLVEDSPDDLRQVCTATILRDNYVLTAAHCLFNENDNRIADHKFWVKRFDVAQLIQVDETFIDSNFDPPTDFGWDYALARLESTFSSPYNDMDISNASDGTIEGLSGAFNLAIPTWGFGCYENSFEQRLYRNEGESLGSVYSRKINLKMDGGHGHSGSPVYYCPNGASPTACDTGEEGRILAVWSGWDGLQTTHVGAKGPAFRTWAIDTMDNNP